MTRRKTGPDRATVALVRARDRDRCRRCGGPGEQIHHRKPRGMGGTKDDSINSPSNLVLLCAADHHWIETHRADARADGGLVSQWADPQRVPLIVNTLPVWLSPDGLSHPQKETA